MRRVRQGRYLKPALIAAGLPKTIRPYDARQSHASMLIKSGMNVVEVAAQMGQSPAMRLSTYAHVVDEFAGRPPVDYEAEIRRARRASDATPSAGTSRAR